VARRSQQRPTDDEWLPLGEASRLLGVNADSLRRWADEGRVDVFTTPGGHRRFARRSLDRLMVPRRATTRPTLARLGATPERVAAAYRRSYVESTDGGWNASTAVGDPDREAWKLRLEGILREIDASFPRDALPEPLPDLRRRIAEIVA